MVAGTCGLCLARLMPAPTRPPSPANPWPCRPCAPSYRGHDAREETTGASLDGGWTQQFHAVIWASLYDATSPAVYRWRLKLCRSPRKRGSPPHDVYLRYLAPGPLRPRRAAVVAYLLLLTRSMALNSPQSAHRRLAESSAWSNSCALPMDLPLPQELTPRPTTWPAACGPPLTPSPPANARCSSWQYTGGSASRDRQPLQLPLAPSKTMQRQALIRRAPC